jgi:competence protein ComEA
VWWHRPNPAPVSPVALPPAAGAAPSVVGSAGGHRTIAVRPPVVTGSAAPSSPAAQHPASAPAPSTTPTGPILVSVTGQVRRPGVVAVPADARVADAIAAAGGALDPSDLTGLNLAAHLVDGASVVVAGPDGSVVDAAGSPAGVPAAGVPPGRAGTTGVASSPVDLNTADQATLETLPGVGPVTAAAILAWRTDHGPFTDVDQLQAIPGIGPAKYAQISPHVTVGQ